MNNTTLGGRLLSVAGFVRQGAVFADIGTDHAHLPIFLLKSGKISRAVCSDINKGPLASAIANVESEGLSGKVDFLLADGCDALEPYGATDYAICGMGGELIASIVLRAPFLRSPEIRLILQPMTKQATLRSSLAENGFTIIDEEYSTDDGKHYLCIVCKYDGVSKKLSPCEAEIGLKTIKKVNISSQISYFDGKIKAYRKKINGLIQSGSDTGDERFILEKMLERRGELLKLLPCEKETL